MSSDPIIVHLSFEDPTAVTARAEGDSREGRSSSDAIVKVVRALERTYQSTTTHNRPPISPFKRPIVYQHHKGHWVAYDSYQRIRIGKGKTKDEALAHVVLEESFLFPVQVPSNKNFFDLLMGDDL